MKYILARGGCVPINLKWLHERHRLKVTQIVLHTKPLIFCGLMIQPASAGGGGLESSK